MLKSERRVEIFLATVRAQRGEGGGRILRGGRTGGGAVGQAAGRLDRRRGGYAAADDVPLF